MFSRDERGQSVILIAVSVVLILAVAFGAYNVQTILVAKQKVRQMTDATALAGALSRKVGLDGYQQLANLDLLLGLSWEIGSAWENILDGAGYLHDGAPGYDPTADFMATDNSIGNIVPIKNHISHVHKKGLVENSTYSKAQQFLMLESILFAKDVEARNLAIPSVPSAEHMSLLIPSEMLINQGPVLSCTNTFYAPYNWTVGSKDGRMIFLVEAPEEPGGATFETTVGIACLEMVNSPQPLFSALMSSFTSGKLGKLTAFAYAYPYNFEDSTGSTFVPIVSFINDLEAVNLTNSNRVKDMKTLSKSRKIKDIEELKDLWDAMVADYNFFLEFCEDIGILDTLDIGSGTYRSNPVMGSIHKLNLLGLTSYQNIADSKGIDYTTEEGEDAFYKTLTLQDVFSSKETFWQDLRTTYQTLIDNNTTFTEDLTDLLGVCKFYDINKSSGNNIPYFFQSVPNLVFDNIQNSTLRDFLTLSQMISEDIVHCFDQLSALLNITSSAQTVTVDSLMPSTDMMDNLTSIFSSPIIRWEGS